MWISIIIAIVATILLFSWGRSRNTPFQSNESTGRNYSGDGGSYYSSVDDDNSGEGNSSDAGNGGGDGGSD